MAIFFSFASLAAAMLATLIQWLVVGGGMCARSVG